MATLHGKFEITHYLSCSVLESTLHIEVCQRVSQG